MFHTSERLVLPLCSLLGASRIVGTKGIHKGLDYLLTHPLLAVREHEIARRLRIVEAIGGKKESENLSFFLQPEEKIERKEGLWIALHPGSKDRFKRWPYFAELGRLLKEELHCEILITGTKEERSLMQEVANLIPGAHIDEPRKKLRDFAAKLNTVDLLISNDTGPVHLASALNIPVVAIYSSTDPFLCGPYKAKNATVIAKQATCYPCMKKKMSAAFLLYADQSARSC